MNRRTRMGGGQIAAITAGMISLAMVASGCGGVPTAPPGTGPILATATAASAEPTPLPTPFDGVRDRHPGFPWGTIAWRTDAPLLPEDRPVGPASLLLWRTQETHLLMPDGTQWAVNSGTAVTLSPNGRWLGYGYGGIYYFRDLTGTEVRTVPAFSGPRGSQAWSPSGRWLIGDAVDGAAPLLDLTTGAIRLIRYEVSTPLAHLVGWGWPVDSGRIVEKRCDYLDRQAIDLGVLDPLDPQQPKLLTFDATRYLRQDERIVLAPADPVEEQRSPECDFRAGPNDEGYLGAYRVPADPRTFDDTLGTDAYLVISLRTGKLLRRVDLSMMLGLGYQVQGPVGDALLFRHFTGADQGAESASELWRLDMRTGAMRMLTRFEAGMAVTAPGPGEGG